MIVLNLIVIIEIFLVINNFVVISVVKVGGVFMIVVNRGFGELSVLLVKFSVYLVN